MIALDKAVFKLSETDPKKLGAADAEIVFVGRSNAGKSTLLNALCRKELARVSNTPGRTRTINVYEAVAGRWLVDLPGYGFASGPEESRAGWGEMIEGYLRGRPNLKMVFILVDAKLGPQKLDLLMLQWLQTEGVPWRVVAARADQVQPSKLHAQRRAVAQAAGVTPEAVWWISALKNEGVVELRREIGRLLA